MGLWWWEVLLGERVEGVEVGGGGEGGMGWKYLVFAHFYFSNVISGIEFWSYSYTILSL